jgi:hypothetical protein
MTGQDRIGIPAADKTNGLVLQPETDGFRDGEPKLQRQLVAGGYK